MRISDWSSDVCSSDLRPNAIPLDEPAGQPELAIIAPQIGQLLGHPDIFRTSGLMKELHQDRPRGFSDDLEVADLDEITGVARSHVPFLWAVQPRAGSRRSEEHTSELHVTNAQIVCSLLIDTKNK